MTGYHRDPGATREALRGGWLHTGDLASVDPGGLFHIRGRKKDVIVVDGRRVSAREIEATLETHPGVLESCVIAAPDPERGETPVGLVVLRGLARPTELDLLEHARSRLAVFKVPSRVEFLARLPRNEAGEVLKSELRTLYSHA
jgi:fatty-acyl-CoA synthase